MAVLDGEPADRERPRRIAAAEVGDRPRLDPRGHRQRLEGRTELVDLVGHAVEHVARAGAIDVVGVERRQRGERKHLAGVDIEHDPRRAERVRRAHAPRQFVLERALHAHVDRQGDRLRAGRGIAQPVVEHRLHAHAAMAVGTDIAQHVRAHRALRIMAVGFLRQFEREFADRVHAVGFFGQHAAAQVARLALGEARGEFGFIDVGEDRRQVARRLRAGSAPADCRCRAPRGCTTARMRETRGPAARRCGR